MPREPPFPSEGGAPRRRSNGNAPGDDTFMRPDPTNLPNVQTATPPRTHPRKIKDPLKSTTPMKWLG